MSDDLDAYLRALRDQVRLEVYGDLRVDRGGGCCIAMSLAIEGELGWPAVIDGEYDDGERHWTHCWNVRPDDGWLVDATADQFGVDDILICPPDDPRTAPYIRCDCTTEHTT